MSDPPEPATNPEAPSTCCLNCGERLHGPYCHACGQRDLDLDRDLRPLVGDAISETFEADGRLPRTVLPFLFSPGAMVRAFLDGQRRRYTSPVRIYVFALFVAFLVFGWLAESDLKDVPDTPLSEAPLNAEGQHEVGSLTVRIDPPEEGEDGDEAEQDWFESRVAPLAEMSQRDLADRLVKGTLTWAPRLVTLMIPVLAAMLQLVYWRRRYLDHLVFALDQHSRGLLLLAVAAVVDVELLTSAMFLGLQAHLLLGLRVVYGHGWLSTAWRWVVVNVFYGTFMMVGWVAVVVLSLVDL